MIKENKEPEIKGKEVKSFIRGAKAESKSIVPRKKEKKEDLGIYLLRIPKNLREEFRIEAIKDNKDMSTYICNILAKRSKK